MSEMTFDEKLKRIEEINETLSSNKTDLEQAVCLFEEGMALTKELEKQLQKLERRIEIVTNDPDIEQGEGLETKALDIE